MIEDERILLSKEVLENLPVGVVLLDNNCKILMLNRKQEETSKIDRSQILGKIYHEIWPNVSNHSVGGGLYWNLINNNVPFSFIFHDATPQFYDSKISGICHGAPISSGEGFILIHEISEEIKKDKIYLAKLNDQVSYQNEFLSSVFDTSPNAIVVTDSDERITKINRTAEDVFDCKLSELHGKHISKIFKDQVSLSGLTRESIDVDVETTCVGIGGREIPARVSVRELKQSGEASSSKLILIRDLSKQKSLELSLTEQLNFEKLISELSASFVHLTEDNINPDFTGQLTKICEFLRIEGVLLGQFSEDHGFLELTHANLPVLQEQIGTDLNKALPWYSHQIGQGNSIIWERVPDDVPEEASQEREYGLEQGVKSCLSLPLVIDTHVYGVLAFISYGSYLNWPEELVKRLELISNIVANALLRIKNQDLLDERLEFEALLSELSAAFITPPHDPDSEIKVWLERIGKLLKIDRCRCIPFDATKDRLNATDFSNKFKLFANCISWTEDNISSEPYQILPQKLPWVISKMLGKELVHFSHVENLPENAEVDRNTFSKFKVKSCLLLPMISDDIVIGVLSFDSLRSNYSWPDHLVQRLKLVGEILVNALSRKRSDESLHKALKEIKQLKDNIEAERNYLKEEINTEHNFEYIIGHSAALKEALNKVKQVAPTDTTALILGETGTGKELFVRAVHHASRRKDKLLIKVNCATLPRSLIESELFGHEKGAFTGAMQKKLGRFELAHGATLFLDEIGELPLDLQAKLLRVIQEGEFERLGGTKTIKVDVRIIAATNRNLKEEVAKGAFRQDLWYRLNVFPITIPPLRQRKNDVPDLARWFIKKTGKKLGRTISHVAAETIQELEAYHWPGNVRELENVIERAIINSAGDTLRLPDEFGRTKGDNQALAEVKPLVEIERDYITRVLNLKNGRVSGPNGAALVLGLHPETLRSRMKKLGITRTQYR